MELSDFIDQNLYEYSVFIREPSALVGQHVSHRFELPDQTFKWYDGTVLKYNEATKTHKLLYEGEETHCLFDLTLDLLNGDLSQLKKSIMILC